MTEIIYTRWNLANKFDTHIELNECLKQDMNLHNAILDHEHGHKNTNTFKQDLIHDLTPINKLSQKDLVIFMLKHPRTWTQLLPVYFSPNQKEWIYDLNMVIAYTIALGLLGLALYLF